MFVGVRNKYCTVCEKLESEKSKKENDHVCFKNYIGTSTSMETDVILEGFKKSIEMHGLIYGKLIGDGDSNVYTKLLSCAPYGPLFHIQKIECKNHILRNYIAKLNDLKNNTAYTVPQRKIMGCKIEKLRIAASSAINFWTKNESQPFNERVLELQEDLSNGPRHVFGDHTLCIAKNKYYCSEAKRATKLAAGEMEEIEILKKRTFTTKFSLEIKEFQIMRGVYCIMLTIIWLNHTILL